MSSAAVEYTPLPQHEWDATGADDGPAAVRGCDTRRLLLLLLLVAVASFSAGWLGSRWQRAGSASDGGTGGGGGELPALGRPAGLLLRIAEPPVQQAVAAADADAQGEGEAEAEAALETEAEAAARLQFNLSLPICPAARFLNELPERPAPPPSLSRECPAALLPPDESWSASVFNASSYPGYIVPVHTFLISFPRSGNSMTRKILEDGTGVVTGSIYGDKGLSKAGLRGERRRANVLLLKHHFLGESAARPFFDVHSIHRPGETGRRAAQYAIQRYIYILRNPMDSLVSWKLFLRSRSHAAGLNNQRLQHLTFHAVFEFLQLWLPVWAEHVRYFTATFPRLCPQCRYLLVRYEEFVQHPSREDERNPTRRMLCFLGYPLHRGCRPEQADASEPAVTYRLKDRLSLFNLSLTLPRTVSYTDEIFAALTPQQIQQLDALGGAEMRQFGYWPHGV